MTPQLPKGLKYENLIIKNKINFRLKNSLRFIKRNQEKMHWIWSLGRFFVNPHLPNVAEGRMDGVGMVAAATAAQRQLPERDRERERINLNKEKEKEKEREKQIVLGLVGLELAHILYFGSVQDYDT